MAAQAITKIGAALRRIPGMSRLLDARLARKWKRAEDEQRAQERRDSERVLAGLSGRDRVRLNVGAGHGLLEGWVNADLNAVPGSEVVLMDATEPWPLGDGSAEAVNSEHFIEHIDRGEAPFYFSEAYRVLQPGGVIRTSTPDLRGLMQAYLDADPRLLEAHRRHGYDARNHADLVNNYVYSWEHRHIYDYETLERLLREAGFEQIERVEFGRSRHPVLQGIDTHAMDELQPIVIAVDAVKPG